MGSDSRRKRTIDVGHHQHLWLGQPLLQVVEVDGAVEGEEADLGASVAGQPDAQNNNELLHSTKYLMTSNEHQVEDY